MATEFWVEIVTPERTFFQGEIESLVVNTVGGVMGILKGNIPLITALKSGELKIKMHGTWLIAAASNGFMEVTAKKALIFCQTIFWPQELEEDELKEKEQRHREALNNAIDTKSYVLAKASLYRTIAKMSVKNQEKDSRNLNK